MRRILRSGHHSCLSARVELRGNGRMAASFLDSLMLHNRGSYIYGLSKSVDLVLGINSWVMRRFLNRRRLTFFFVHANGTAVSL
jgi:hypothetical protein